MDNGTYLCHSKNEYGSDTTVVHTVVQDKPQVKIEYVRGVDMDKIFFNWTLTDWNAPVTDYRLSVSYYLISLPNAATFHKLFFCSTAGQTTTPGHTSSPRRYLLTPRAS